MSGWPGTGLPTHCSSRSRSRRRKQSGLRSFAIGIRNDQQAVTNGLTLHWNSGRVEGTVNKIKMIKRQMYGRAGFDLLRKRGSMRRSRCASNWTIRSWPVRPAGVRLYLRDPASLATVELRPSAPTTSLAASACCDPLRATRTPVTRPRSRTSAVTFAPIQTSAPAARAASIENGVQQQPAYRPCRP